VVLKKAGALFPEQGSIRLGAAGQNFEMQTQEVILGPDWHGNANDLKQFRCLFDRNHILLTGPNITDEHIEAARLMPEVDYVEIKRTKLKDAALQKLRGIRQLQQLAVCYTPITDASIDVLKTIPLAGEMKLYGTEMTLDGSKQLGAAL